jgi:NAD(P)-dependent dehydrogenase (short-subunit alcohol dehydrogenase family)
MIRLVVHIHFLFSLLSLTHNHMTLAFESCGTALVTGATDGIGVTTAKHLARAGYNVLIHGRDRARIQKAKDTVRSFVGNEASPKIIPLPPADLSTVHGSRKLAADVRRVCQTEDLDLKVLMNNAGVYSEKHIVTSDGTELTFAVNVVAPFVITSQLLPTMLQGKTTIDRRVVIASSISQCGSIRDWNDMAYQNRAYSAHSAYSESKLLDAMLTMEFADRLLANNIGTECMTVNCLDPGTVNTKMLLAGWGRIGIDVEDALDQTWLCSSDEVKGVTGKYFTYQNERRAGRSAYENSERKKMWEILSDLAPEESKVWDFDWL